MQQVIGMRTRFPFLFGGTFIEGQVLRVQPTWRGNFPSFSEGLSLRVITAIHLHLVRRDFPSFSEGLSLRDQLRVLDHCAGNRGFPFLFGGTFIEGDIHGLDTNMRPLFPFLFGGTFIEGL